MSTNDQSVPPIFSYFKNFKQDLPAGFVVFLVALPLCLGIALASDAPLASGLLSGAIAGLIVSGLSGSQLSVSGPAAGLTLTITSAIAALGSFDHVLVAIAIAGLAQIIFGLCRIGILASFFPHSVIKGMLAAIGLIIILKQIPHAVGWDKDFVGDESFTQRIDHENTFSSLANLMDRMNGGAIIVALATTVVIYLWGLPALKKLKIVELIPAPLVAVIGGLLTNEALMLLLPEFALTSEAGHLVQLPTGGLTGFLAQLPHPQWAAISNTATWKVAATIAIIASIESLLCIEATDKLDPDRRVSDPNRELIAQGTGNLLCGMFGALPMTSVIVRSSANIYAGGKTRLSCFIHGVFLLTSVLFLAGFLNRIPLAALAVVLISVGFKLVNFGVIKTVLNEGFEQYLPFFVTLAAIVFTDLLTGVAVGLAVGLIIVVRMNHPSALTLVSDEDNILIRFAKDVSFFHKPALKQMLSEIPNGKRVVIDGTGAQFIDHDIAEVVKDFAEGAVHRNLKIYFRNMKSKRMSARGIEDGKLQESVASQ